jgi:hypothetical protein
MLARLREWVRDLQIRYGTIERQFCFTALQFVPLPLRYDCASGR